MNIYINEEKIDTTLNGETQLSQVIDQMTQWIENNGKYLLHFTVDGKEVSSSEIQDLEVSTTERLDFFIGEELDMIENSLVELDSYVDKVGNTLVGRDSLTEQESNDLKEGMPWIESMIFATKNILHLNLSLIRPMGNGKNVEEIIVSLKEGSSQLDSMQSIEAFLENLRDLKLFLMDLSGRLALVRLSDVELKEIISGFLDRFESVKKDFMLVNENFQSGKDHLANEILTDAISDLNSVISAIVTIQQRYANVVWSDISIDGKTFSEISLQLNQTLGSVAQAMEKNDIVLAGDILEYELPDLLEAFYPFLKEVIQKV